jgi:3-oxoacyl-(acyl-carrier-protein) synthase/NAD(P)-dependent dehydrogenase (short-subunit alcohol dehydrogenase family)/acyl carrier protein
VYGTASPSKWDVVRAMGVTDVANSRDTTFAEKWKDVGITVVLNALAREFVDASLSLVKPGGRFVEMGKTDVRDAAAIEASHGVWYRAFDLVEAGPERIRTLFGELRDGLASGALKPGRTKVHHLGEMPSVFRTMAGGGHVGKLVFATGAGRVRADGAVLISGGTGALGAVTAQWLVDRGARALVLLSRRGEGGLDDAARALVAGWRASGVEVELPAIDVTDAAALRSWVEGYRRPIRGVVHAAGVLDDVLVRNTTPEQVARVVRPKFDGMKALEAATAGAELDLFLAFTSIAGPFGSPGQAAYSAANGWLDGRMRERRAAGLPGQTIAWGPWGERGMAVHVTTDETVRKLGDREGAALLEAIVRRGTAVTFAVPMTIPREAPSADQILPFFRQLIRVRSASGASAAAGAFAERVAGMRAAEREEFVRSEVRGDVARVLGVPEAKVAGATPLQELGMDSLLAVEIRNVLSKRLGERLPATVAFDHPSVDALTAMVLAKVGGAAADERPSDVRTSSAGAAIAVVGLGSRFPGGADTLDQYWRILLAARPVAGDVPAERWDHASIYQPGDPTPGKTNARRAAFMTDPFQFDAGFFGIADSEAETLDPQQRMALQVGWEAFEDAGLSLAALKDTRTGVYFGVASTDWTVLRMQSGDSSAYDLTGSDGSFIPGRVAYAFGLRGPAIAVNTACSSSLVAVHHAVRGLQAGDCDVALAGGVNAILNREGMVTLAQLGALASDGTCKTFSARGDGYGRGEGCALLVLKRLADAERDGDRILGVIRGVAVNSDGRSSGLTAPSGPAQQVVMRDALAFAGLQPTDVDFLECHGTGTRLGDPIEVQAAAEVYAVGREADKPLLIGSAKAVVGHLEDDGGRWRAIMKLVLALRPRAWCRRPWSTSRTRSSRWTSTR